MKLVGGRCVFQQRKKGAHGLPVQVDHASHAEVADGARVDPHVPPGVPAGEAVPGVRARVVLVVEVARHVRSGVRGLASGPARGNRANQPAHDFPDVWEPTVQLGGVRVGALLDVLQHLVGVHVLSPVQVHPSLEEKVSRVALKSRNIWAPPGASCSMPPLPQSPPPPLAVGRGLL